ncbi:hypothetical protein JCM14469_34980 [Desulfatiferula olefinivorans]
MAAAISAEEPLPSESLDTTVQAVQTKPETPNPWRIRGRSETIVEWKDDSANDNDTTWRQELSLGIGKNENNVSMGLDIRGRATNNETVDERDARLLYFQGYYKSAQNQAELGDVAASFNPLVISASLKGTKLSHQSGDTETGWNAGLIGGIQKASWSDLFNESDTEPYDRYIIGANTERFFGTGRQLSFSTAFIKDADYKDSGDPLAVSAGPAEALTLGTSWDWRFNRYLKTRGEAALTRCDDNTDDSGSHDNAGAVRLKLLTAPNPKYLKSDFYYERIDTDFTPFTASAAADREKFENDSTLMISRKARIRLSLKHSRDNLDGSLGGTQTVKDGVTELTLRPDWLKRGDCSLRQQLKHTDGRGTDQSLAISQIDFSIRPKSGWKYGLGFIYTDIDDDTAGMEDQEILTLRNTLGWTRTFANDHQFRSTLRIDTNNIRRDSGDQNTLGGKIDLGYDAGAFWSADLSATTRDTYRDAADDSDYTAYEISGSYHPGGDRSRAIRLNASRRDTDSGTPEETARLAYIFSF